MDPITLRGLDKDTAEQANHTARMKQMVRIVGWHSIFNASDKVVTPCSVLTAHVFLFRRVLFFVALEKSFLKMLE